MCCEFENIDSIKHYLNNKKKKQKKNTLIDMLPYIKYNNFYNLITLLEIQFK